MLPPVSHESEGAAAEEFEQALSQLSVRIMVEGIGPAVLDALRALGEQAHEKGRSNLSARTLLLVNALTNSSGSQAGEIFKTGTTELLLMVKNERSDLPSTSAPAYSSLGDDAELIADFLIEAREHLSLIEGQLLSLERDPSAMETIHAVFRAFHTIKGLAGFLGFPAIQAVSHEVETLLDLARNGKLIIDTPIVDVVLASSDFLLVEMASIDRVLGGASSATPADNNDLIAKIRSLAVIAPTDALGLAVPDLEAAAESKPQELTQNDSMEQSADSAQTPQVKHTFQAAVVSDIIHGHPAESQDHQTDAIEEDFFAISSVDPKSPAIDHPATALAGSLNAVSTLATPSTTKTGRAVEPLRTAEATKTPDSGSVRVETAKLDHLMDMVGEMVIAQSLIRHSQILLNTTDSRLIGDMSHLARVTAEVQRATMSMRMVPVAQLFQKIERVIRDLSRKAGKQVVLQTSGIDTEVDKTVAEELSDPLLHMVRNSVDHGIEAPDERVKAGKPPIATIKLAAYHQGGQVIIEVSDDGRGLNAEKIRLKAEQKDIVSSSAQLTEAEVYQLIFAPGFSTAEKITDVSGRGVGMDVVRRNVEKLRGRIETQSELGRGTTFLLKLPLTLAIIDGLVVEVGQSHYIVPLSVVREIFRPPASTLFSVEGREEMVLVREQLLPVVRLSQRLGIKPRFLLPSEGLLVVIESENKLYCMLVDDLLGKQEVVIKSLGETFQDASGFSGCAVLSDGRVGLILDTDGIYRGRRR